MLLVSWKRGELSSINWRSEKIPFIDLESDDVTIVNGIISGVREGYSEFLSPFKLHTETGKIVASDGKIYCGTFQVIANYNEPSAALKSEYLKNTLAEYSLPIYSFDDIQAFMFLNGNVVDKDNKIVGMYRDRKKLDEFDMESVRAGMPWELVRIGLDAHSFKDFYTALISIDRTSEYGNTQCYSLYGDNFRHLGNMWVRNGTVESITMY
ncbi:MAG: hypothetical protein IKH11_04225 [Bacteroidales bacterium]|nr:hypothetical protein [Bacteroidales bacterium]